MHHGHEQHQHGEIIVTGCDKVEFHLKSLPRSVQCLFRRKHHPAPCNPHRHHNRPDTCRWEVRQVGFFRRKYILTIYWKVFSAREIVWSVNY